MTDSEAEMFRLGRRSLVVAHDISAGESSAATTSPSNGPASASRSTPSTRSSGGMWPATWCAMRCCSGMTSSGDRHSIHSSGHAAPRSIDDADMIREWRNDRTRCGSASTGRPVTPDGARRRGSRVNSRRPRRCSGSLSSWATLWDRSVSM